MLLIKPLLWSKSTKELSFLKNIVDHLSLNANKKNFENNVFYQLSQSNEREVSRVQGNILECHSLGKHHKICSEEGKLIGLTFHKVKMRFGTIEFQIESSKDMIVFEEYELDTNLRFFNLLKDKFITTIFCIEEPPKVFKDMCIKFGVSLFFNIGKDELKKFANFHNIPIHKYSDISQIENLQGLHYSSIEILEVSKNLAVNIEIQNKNQYYVIVPYQDEIEKKDIKSSLRLVFDNIERFQTIRNKKILITGTTIKLTKRVISDDSDYYITFLDDLFKTQFTKIDDYIQLQGLVYNSDTWHHSLHAIAEIIRFALNTELIL